MNYIYLTKFFGVMFAIAFADVCWTFYFIKVNERKPISSGVWATLIYVFGAFTITSYVDDKTLIIPAIIGSFVGTAATVEYKRRKELKK